MEYLAILIVLPALGLPVFSTFKTMGIKVTWKKECDKLYNYYKD